MAIVLGADFDHIDMQAAAESDATRRPVKDAVSRDLIANNDLLLSDLGNAVFGAKKYDWTTDSGTTNFPYGWRPGYYSSQTGSYASASTAYMCTAKTISIEEDGIVKIAVPEGYVPAIYVYESNGAFVPPRHGTIDNRYNAHPNSAATRVKKGQKINFGIGRWTSDDPSTNYITDYTADDTAFLANVVGTVYYTAAISTKKLPRTGEFEFFTVQVERPLQFNGDVATTQQETIQCVLRLPDSYSPTGKPTRLVLACHGSSGLVEPPSTWYNSNWKSFMDSLLAAGYACFDSNVFPLGMYVYGDKNEEAAGKADGSPLYVNILKKAYDYILENYNVYPQIFAHGTSMGGVGASAFTWAYPELVLAQSSFAGRDMNYYLYLIAQDIETGIYTHVPNSEIFAKAYGYTTYAELLEDKFSHVEGGAPSMTLIQCNANGTMIYPPDRETQFLDWLKYYAGVQISRRTNLPNYLMRRSVPYLAFNAWNDREINTMGELIMQKACRAAGGAPYICVTYEDASSVEADTGKTIAAHTNLSYGKIDNMREKLINWFKRWE